MEYFKDRCGVLTTTTASITCVDKLNPKTGVSGKFDYSSIGNFYKFKTVPEWLPIAMTRFIMSRKMFTYPNIIPIKFSLMTDQCPKTCGKV